MNAALLNFLYSILNLTNVFNIDDDADSNNDNNNKCFKSTKTVY